jgi:hypothetical protein
MSEATSLQTGAPPSDPAASGDVETRARMMGWKPKAEFRGGDDANWLPADEFLDRGFASPAVMADRLKVMTDRMARMERDGHQMSTKFDQAVETINTMTNMARTSERRAYERARSDLDRERVRAVESGDTQGFQRLDAEIQKLDKDAPPAPQPRQTQPAPVQAPPGPPAQVDPAVTEFYRRNPWYGRDAAMTAEADLVHTGLLNTRRDLTMDQNLAEVERRIARQFTAAAQPAAQPAGGDPDNPRRSEPGAVSPASAGGGPRQRQSRRTFATMPEESKQAYRRYKGMLAGKGEPLTEDEWATDYWSQFEEES